MADEKNPSGLRNQLFELLPSGVGVFDVKDKVIKMEYLNNGYYQMLGTTREQRQQYAGVHTAEAIYPDDLAGLLEEEENCIREKRLFHYRFRILDGKGNYRWFVISANHFSLPDGSERFFASYYDVDEFVKNQEKLKEEEYLSNEFFRYSDNLNFVYYPERHAYQILVLPDSLKSFPKTMDDFPESLIEFAKMNEGDAEKYREMVRKIDRGEKEAECTVRICYQGKYTWYRNRILNHFNAEGQPSEAIGFAIDVDKLKNAEASFNEEKLLVRSLKNEIEAASCFNVTKDCNIELANKELPSFDHNTDFKSLLEEACQNEPDLRQQNPETVKALLTSASKIPNRKERNDFIREFCHFGMLRSYEAGKKEVKLLYRRWTERGLIWVSTRLSLIEDPESGDILAFFTTTDVNDQVIYSKITGRILLNNYENVSYYDMNSKMLYVRMLSQNIEGTFQNFPYEKAVEEGIEAFVAPEEMNEVKRKYSIDNIIYNLRSQKIYSIFYAGNRCDLSLPGQPIKRMKTDFFYLDENQDIIVILQSNVTAIFEQEKAAREKMAEAMSALEVANKSKNEFISRISHDIRTPISIIKSITDFALADIDDKEKLQDDLSKIKSADTFLLSLINDVLDISKIDSGKIELSPEPYPFSEYRKDISNIFQPMCDSKGLTFAFDLSDRSGAGIIYADKIRINQIALNLISNAVKYTPAGGKVTYVSHSKDLPDGKILFDFEIVDTGIGMSEAFQKTMFEPFTQEYDNPSRPKGMTGTGLGLSIVKRIVDLMGGKITVRSKLGKGTSIRVAIVFPDASKMKVAQDRKKEEEKYLASQPLSGQVLMAEDNPINAEIAIRILSSFGVSVTWVENGAKAVSAFVSSKPGEYRAILMDIQMPLLNGYEATKQIRALKRPDAKTIPIIALTADAFSSAAEEAKKAGMDGYLVKPLDPALIRKTLAAYLK
jgi:signal transduction histidine kinase/ActR/RegA family two-component response regulator